MTGLNAVARLIGGAAGIDTARAEHTFDVCTAALRQSAWPQVVGRFSRLTAEGSPVEFVFSSADNGLRYTVETGGPEMPDDLRLNAGCEILERLGHASPPANLIREWRALQSTGPLRWGCWMGIRHNQTGEKAKLYIETPNVGQALLPARSLPGSRLTMIGYEAGIGRIEYYFRKKPVIIGDLRLLDHNAPEELEKLFTMPIETALSFFAPGYSVSGINGQSQVALFLRAGWIGGAAAARRHLLARDSGGALDAYRQLLGRTRDHDLPDHGVLTLDPGGSLRAGLSGGALASLL